MKNRRRVVDKASMQRLWELVEVKFGKPLTSGNVYNKSRQIFPKEAAFDDLIEAFKIFLQDLNQDKYPIAKKRRQLSRSILYQQIWSPLNKEQSVSISEEVATILCLYVGFENINSFLASEQLLHRFFIDEEPNYRRPLKEPLTSPSGAGHTPQFTSTLVIPDVDFTGRVFLVKEIDQFLRESQNGYFIIEGDPGIGKTEFLKKLIMDRGYPHHLNIRAEGINSPHDFLFNICGQLLGKFYEYKHIRSLAWEPNTHFLKQLLTDISRRHGSATVVIDALDETIIPESLGQLQNPINLPQALPRGIHFVVTTRRTSQNLLTTPDTDVTKFTLAADSEENIIDIIAFIERRISSSTLKAIFLNRGFSKSQFVNTLLQKSEGNFMYLKYFFTEFEKGKIKDIDDLPLGLTNYYENHWSILKMNSKKEWQTKALPILTALVAQKAPMTLADIQHYTRIESAHEINFILEEWLQFFHTTGSGAAKKYRLYHASFLDFLEAKESIQIGLNGYQPK